MTGSGKVRALSAAGKVFAFPRWLVRQPYRWCIFWLITMPLVFAIDQHLTQGQQLVTGLVLWWLLIGALTTRTRNERILLAVLVAVATCGELTASLILHWYTYRLHNVPMWVPPGHGIVFFTALLCTEIPWVREHATALRNVVATGVIVYAIWGLMSPRFDVAGAVFGGVLLGLLWLIGSQKSRFYTMLWPWVCLLELSGVWLGAWVWADRMPITHFSQGNPPSGIAGAYGSFDLIAFLIAGLIIRYLVRKRTPKPAYAQNLAHSD